MDSADSSSSPPEIIDHEDDEIVYLGIFPKQEVVLDETEDTLGSDTIPSEAIFLVIPNLFPLSPKSRQSLYTTPTKKTVCQSQECSSSTSPVLDIVNDFVKSPNQPSDNSVSCSQEIVQNSTKSSDLVVLNNIDCNANPSLSSPEHEPIENPAECSTSSALFIQQFENDDNGPSLFLSDSQDLAESETRQEKLRQQLKITFKDFRWNKCSCDGLTTRRGHSTECPRINKRKRVVEPEEEIEEVQLVDTSNSEDDLSDCSSTECNTQLQCLDRNIETYGETVERQKSFTEAARKAKKKKRSGFFSFQARGKMYEVDSIVASSIQYGHEYRMVHWKGYDVKSDSWELRSQLAKQVPEMLFRYEESRKEKFRQLNNDIVAGFTNLLPCSYSQQDKRSVRANRCYSKLRIMCDPLPESVCSSLIERLQGKTIHLVPRVPKKLPNPLVRKMPEPTVKEKSPELSQGEKYSAALHAVLLNGDHPGSPTLKAKNIKKVIEALIKAKARKRPGYVYFLIDPKEIEKYDIENLSLEAFLSSIIYIGKGTKSRSDQHLVDADRFDSPNKNRKEPKVNRLLEIWENDGEIIPFHLFDYADDDVAFLLEAAMIQAVGLRNLTNKMRGHLSRFQTLDIEPKPTNDEIAEFGALLLLDAHMLFTKTAFLFPPVPRSKVRFREKQRLEQESQQDSQQQAVQNSSAFTNSH